MSEEPTAPSRREPPPNLRGGLPPSLREADPSRGQLARDVVRYAVPVVIGTLSHTALDVADTLMVGRLGETALAAVGLGSFAALIAVVVLGAVQVGAQAVAGRRVGEGRPREAGRVLDNALLLAALAGTAASLLGWLFPEVPFLAARDPQVREAATSYFALRALGLLPTMATFAFRGFFFGVGRMGFSMAIMVGVNLLNVVLNYALIFGAGPVPALGTDGAALATTLAVSAGLLACIAVVRLPDFREDYGALHLGNLDRALIGTIVRVSLPRVFQAGALSCFYAFVAVIEQVGTAEAAAANIIFKVHSLPFHVALGTGFAAATLVAQSLGAGRPELAERFGRTAAAVGFVATSALGVAFALGAAPIVALFTTKPEVVAAGTVPFVLVALGQGVDSIGIVFGRALHGAGDTLYILVAELVVGWGVFFPLGWALAIALAAPIEVVWTAYLAYMACFALATWLRFRSGRWKTIEV